MTILYVYDHLSRGIETHRLSRGDPLPYLAHGHISAGQFLAGSHTDIAWTDRRLLYAYDRLCALWGEKLTVCGGFRRLQSGGCREQSPHYAGLALNITCRDGAELESLRKLTLGSGIFTRVDPSYLTPTWLHGEVCVVPPALAGNGYPVLTPDICGVHVFVLQDALILTGDHRGALTGRMDAATLEAAARFRQKAGLSSPMVGGLFWKALFRALRKK